jgi:hypothetical protein
MHIRNPARKKNNAIPAPKHREIIALYCKAFQGEKKISRNVQIFQF